MAALRSEEKNLRSAVAGSVRGGGEFAPGFRFSVLDGFVLVTGAVVVASLVVTLSLAAGVLGFVLLHFFLFCNVFRITRRSEILWASVFVTLAVASLLGSIGWSTTFVASAGLAAVVVGIEMRMPGYHGVLWARVNPNLHDWYEDSRRR